jgi:hypothetical protein
VIRQAAVYGKTMVLPETACRRLMDELEFTEGSWIKRLTNNLHIQTEQRFKFCAAAEFQGEQLHHHQIV